MCAHSAALIAISKPCRFKTRLRPSIYPDHLAQLTRDTSQPTQRLTSKSLVFSIEQPDLYLAAQNVLLTHLIPPSNIHLFKILPSRMAQMSPRLSIWGAAKLSRPVLAWFGKSITGMPAVLVHSSRACRGTHFTGRAGPGSRQYYTTSQYLTTIASIRCDH